MKKPVCDHSIEQHFYVARFITLWIVVLTVKATDETLLCNPLKAIDHCHVQDGFNLQTLVCDHSNESQAAVHSCGTLKMF